jgi:hypothetical protein
MSKIIATDHLETLNWEVTFEDLQSNYADLFIRFTDEAPIVEFKDLKFKYELKQSGNIKQYGVFPPPGVRYIRSDQDYLVAERLDLKAETEYELYLWVENDGKSFERTIIFTTPRPLQPYPSWIWDGETWNAPISYPDDGKYYIWNEENQEWAEFLEK